MKLSILTHFLVVISLIVSIFGHRQMQKNLIDLSKIPDDQPIVLNDGQFFKNKTILFNDGTVGQFDVPIAKKLPKSKKIKQHQEAHYNGPAIKELRRNSN